MNKPITLEHETLWEEFRTVRRRFIRLCEPLGVEDHALQAAPFTSPPKWHLAHTTWFFETFLLKPFLADYHTPEPLYEVLFNSYYNGIGDQFPRPQRGLLSRPTLEEVIDYRSGVEAALEGLLQQLEHPQRGEILARLRLGIEHELQHQELFFTDLKYSLFANPLLPAYTPAPAAAPRATSAQSGGHGAPEWHSFDGGLHDIGFTGDGFCFDNELPRHRSYLQPFALAGRLVSNGEYAEFVADGGYRRPELWLADGWAAAQEHNWQAPLYWIDREGQALEYTLHGLTPRLDAQPVCHVSGYEADAYARWAGARLPTEQEWEVAASAAPGPGRAARENCCQPQPASEDTAGLLQLYDACWQWTRSAYTPYPGYRASAGAIGEYNGKFMSSQWVLRGGSCASLPAHLRRSYRNFFYPPDRWQFSGIRLARDIH